MLLSGGCRSLRIMPIFRIPEVLDCLMALLTLPWNSCIYFNPYDGQNNILNILVAAIYSIRSHKYKSVNEIHGGRRIFKQA